jgi:hypothetical protein
MPPSTDTQDPKPDYIITPSDLAALQTPTPSLLTRLLVPHPRPFDPATDILYLHAFTTAHLHEPAEAWEQTNQ